MDNVKLIQKAIIKKGGKFLFLKRSENDKNLPGYWDMPGGKPNFGENPEKALLREVKEETNLAIKIISPLAVTSFISKISGEYCFCVGYLCETKSDKIKLSEEHSEFKWVALKEAKKLKIAVFIHEFLKNL